MNCLNVINMTKYINVNNETSFIYVISHNYHQVCNTLKVDDLTDNETNKTRHF